MTKFLKQVCLALLGVLTLGTLALTAYSYWRVLEWDLSKDGVNWKCVHVRDGTILFAFVNADAAPKLTATSPSMGYRGCVQLYAQTALQIAMRNRSKAMLEQMFETECIRKEKNPMSSAGTRRYWRRMEKTLEMSELAHSNLIQTINRYRLYLNGFLNNVVKDKSRGGFFLNIGSSPREFVLRLPLAAFILLFGLAPTAAIFHRMRIRSRHKKENLCLTCGYNLTGNLSGTCPECGKAIA